jgi:glutathione S-transferase
MLRIHDYKGFPNPTRVRIAVAEKGLQDEIVFVNVNVPAAEHKTPAFLARNPAGTVPVLELDDGTHIAECTAITEFLDHMNGMPVLTGATGRDRALIHMMQRRAEAGLLDAAATYFHHATPGLGPHIETYQCREWGEKSRERALAGMRYLDQVLERQPFIAGARFTMADITTFAGLLYADIAKIDVPPELGRLRAWRARVSERPSISLL